MAEFNANGFKQDISSQIKENEELLWKGKPQKASFVFSGSITLMPIAIIWLMIDGIGLSAIFRSNMPPFMYAVVIVFFAFHLIPVWLWIHTIISSSKKQKRTEYAFTNERIIVVDNGILKSYYYKNLRRASVRQGLIDKIFKVGDITLSGQKQVTLYDLDNPYAVGNKLQQFIDEHEEEREKEFRSRNYEYEEYRESEGRGNFGRVSFGIGGTNFKGRYDNPNKRGSNSVRYSHDDAQNYYDIDNIREEETPNEYVVNGRYTSTEKQDAPDRTDEDEYLDNILSSINKKDDEF